MSFKRTKCCTRLLRIFAVLFICLCCYNVVFKCTWTQYPENLARNQTWQPVNKENTAYVFSAYLDEQRHIVIIIGALANERATYICQLWSPGGDGVSLERDRSYPRAHTPPEHHHKRYAMTLFECPYKSANYPKYVSLISNTCDKPLNLMYVEETRKPRMYTRTFTVCLSPLILEYSRAYELVEWIELNRILGAEKFVIYNYSSTSNIKQVLEYYSKRGLIDVIQWRLPMTVDTFPVTEQPSEIHYFAQAAALNDCLYRNKRTSEFIVNIDLDEFIIPHSMLVNWKEMIREVDTEKAKVFVFKNTHFRKDWFSKHLVNRRTDLIEKAKRFKLTTLQTFKREQTIDIKGVRSKYMVRTNGVHYLMIHFVLGLPLTMDISVSKEIGLLHHYKRSDGHKLELNDSVTDYTVLDKYGNRLVRNVDRVWDELSHVDMGI